MTKPSRSQVLIVVVIGVIGVSLSAIWIRLTVGVVGNENKVGFSLFLAALRMMVSTAVLIPIWSKIEFKKASGAYYYAIAAGICLAVHFATWITSLSYTSIAASTVLVTTNPIWVGLFSWWWYGEKLTPGGVLGIILALFGGMIMALADRSDLSSYSNHLLGDGLALFGAVMSSLYIIFGSQAQRQGLNTSSYVAIAYPVAALCLFPLPFVTGSSYLGYEGEVYVYVLLMTLTSQLIGHTSLNWAVRWLSPTLISLSLLFEPAIASFIGAIAFNEIPSVNVLLGGSIVLLGIAIYAQTSFD